MSAIDYLWQPRTWSGLHLYKFTKRAHLDAFFADGTFRLSTLREFGDSLGYGKARFDAREGEHRVYRDRSQFEIDLDREHPDMRRDLAAWVSDPQNSGKRGVSYEYFSAVDAYIFCTSRIFTEPLFLRWFDEEGADACYEIHDVRTFTRALAKAATGTILHRHEPCVYVDGPINAVHLSAQLPGMVKDREGYEWQQEHRAFFGLSPYIFGSISGWILQAADARIACHPVAFVEQGKVRYA